MRLIDTHCHLDDEHFDSDRRQVIERAKSAGVDCFIVPSVCEHGWAKLTQMASGDRSIMPAYGMHPWFCDRHTTDGLNRLSALLDDAVAVGECGLDFGKGRASEEEQLRWFRPQLKLAEYHGLPVIVHAYKSLDRVLSELREVPGLTGVIHSFSGSIQQAEKVIGQGFYLGVGSSITHPQASKLREMVGRVPIEKILFETDAPFQPGALHGGERSEPANLIEIANEIAMIRGLPLSELTEIIYQNSRELFFV